ncbi:MAG: multidrug DMT transporter permease [Porphyromonadaceae bacterium]|nr:MAG: multidrug DMT transporter permease [Porphyromonadaceae bacterium]
MFIVSSYTMAVVFCFITMLCWGSWANTQKIAAKSWRFELFYWDYVLGMLLFSLLFGLTFGSSGAKGMSFAASISQASVSSIVNPIIGGVIFNLSNILLVAAISIAGLAIAFPVGVGLCMVLGVIINYIATPKGNPVFLFIGMGIVLVAIIIDAIAYKKLAIIKKKTPTQGIALSVVAGFLMAWFFRFIASAIASDPENTGAGMAEAGKLTPYAAFFFFSIGVLVSNFLFNTYLMKKPIEGAPVSFKQYFNGNFRSHLSGIIGGMVWALGTCLSLLAANKAGYAISFGLGQCATMIGALWGVFIWKEFKGANKSVNWLLAMMFLLFTAGLALIIIAGNN